MNSPATCGGGPPRPTRLLIEGAAGTPRIRLIVVPIELAEANMFIAQHHRHHAPVVGHRFSIGAVSSDGLLHGVAVVGRPVARLAGHPRDVAEVTRLCTDGTPNTCSLLYAAAARAAKAIGFIRIQTYILDTETGASLRAAGWQYDGPAGGGQWKHTDGKPRRTDQPIMVKGRWSRTLNNRPSIQLAANHPHGMDDSTIQETLPIDALPSQP